MTGGHHLTESFIRLDVEQLKSKISLHLDACIRETLDIYQAHPATKTLRPKSILMQPGYVLTSEDVPEMPEKKRQIFDRSMVALLQFAVTWVSFGITYAVGQLARFCA